MSTLRDLLPILPSSLNELLHSNIVGLPLDSTKIETEGDIEEIILLISNQINGINQFEHLFRLSNIQMLISLYNLSLASCTVMTYDEFSNFNACRKFRSFYPSLFKTLLVFGWD